MAFKTALLLGLLALSTFAAASETILDEVQYHAYPSDVLGKAHTIPKSWFDTLIECHVIFPNGVVYQAYPINNLPEGNVAFLSAAQPFTACGIQIRPVSSEDAGTYELYSFVDELSVGSGVTLTRQKFTLHVLGSDVRANEPDE